MEVSVPCDQARPYHNKLFGCSDREVGGFGGEGYTKPSLLSGGSTNDESTRSEVKDGYCQRLSMLLLAFGAAVGRHGLASAALGGDIINMIQHITTPGNIG
ncbi:hypothetical protein QR685DRAFT_569049 [Neurospora intermedia]|uniref:Uncharacterized protein n=1 Tax=Neurospora intermedia TaxID=5142 RepID=A0ABR3DJQ3_NEUIN